MPPQAPAITLLLQDIRAGNRNALDELVPLVYDELRAVARGQLRRERAGHTLNSIDLVNEAYANLSKGEPLAPENRAHFFGIIASTMRRVLVDRARARLADKRGGGAEAVPLDELELAIPQRNDERVVALDGALHRLAQVDEEAMKIVELRYFVGMNEEEAAQAVGLSRATAGRRWAFAKAFLYQELKDGFDP